MYVNIEEKIYEYFLIAIDRAGNVICRDVWYLRVSSLDLGWVPDGTFLFDHPIKLYLFSHVTFVDIFQLDQSIILSCLVT